MILQILMGSALGWIAFAVPLAIAIGGGLWSWSRLRRPPLSERPDLPSARSLAAGLATVVGLIAAALVGLGAVIGSAWTGNINWWLVLVFAGLASLAGPVTWLAALFGYAVLARKQDGRGAVAGTIGGPALLLAAILVAAWTVQAIEAAGVEAELAAQRAQEQAWVDASANLHAALEAVEVDLVDFHDLDTGLPRTGIETVRLTLLLRADVELPLGTSSGDPAGGYVDLVPIGPILRGCVVSGELPDLGASIPAGRDVRIPLTLSVPTDCENQPAPGLFDASVGLNASANGFDGRYFVAFRVTIPG